MNKQQITANVHQCVFNAARQFYMYTTLTPDIISISTKTPKLKYSTLPLVINKQDIQKSSLVINKDKIH